MPAPVTNVPFPTFDEHGIVLPTEDAILAGVQADINAAFGADLDFSTTTGGRTNATPQGQLASSMAAIIGDNFAVFAWFVNQQDPAYNSGRGQDGIARIYFIDRKPGLPTVQPCICLGLAGVQIPLGLLAQDPQGIQWLCQESATIPLGGSITLNFACVNFGPTAAPGSFPTFQAVPGLDQITPTGSAVVGQLEESPAQFELRRSLSTGLNSMGPLNAIYGAVAQVPGVLDVFCYSNDSNATVVFGGITLQAHEVYVCFLGGDAQAVAFAAWQRKMPGAPWYAAGNLTVPISDPNPAYTPPAPTYTVKLEVANPLAFAVLVILKNNAGVPSNALPLIQTAIINAFAGLDGGLRAKIGSTVLASRLYAGVLALGIWAQIVDIQVGVSGAAAGFTASIAGTTMTVTVIGAGALAAGQLVQDITATLVPGTLIVAQLTGSPGSTGTYQVSISQSVSSEVMTATTLDDSAAVNINQAPAVSASNIALVLV